MSQITCTELQGRHGKLATININRPTALNACTKEICIEIRQHLEKWQQDDQVFAVFIKGEGGKAFCAGGDIRFLYENKDQTAKSISFFQHEYINNLTIAEFTKPYIAWLDGITMGGGIGLSIHGSHRIATEKTLMAMPEAAIGLFPDIGGGYFLPRLDNYAGWYLALSGARINAREAFETGLANHFIASDQYSI